MCLTGEADRLWSTYVDVAQDAAVSGNLVTDAHLVALMREKVSKRSGRPTESSGALPGSSSGSLRV